MKESIVEKGLYLYHLTASIIRSEDFDTTIVCGIKICGEGRCVSVNDISDDYEAVRKLFLLIVEEELVPEHLIDVVEDWLTEWYTPSIQPFTKNHSIYTA